MVDYQEINATRRISYLIRHADGANFSVLNFVYYIAVLALVVAAIASVLGLL